MSIPGYSEWNTVSTPLNIVSVPQTIRGCSSKYCVHASGYGEHTIEFIRWAYLWTLWAYFWTLAISIPLDTMSIPLDTMRMPLNTMNMPPDLCAIYLFSVVRVYLVVLDRLTDLLNIILPWSNWVTSANQSLGASSTRGISFVTTHCLCKLLCPQKVD